MLVPEAGKACAKLRDKLLDEANDPTLTTFDNLSAAVVGKGVAFLGMVLNPIEYLNETLNPESDLNRERRDKGKD